MKYVRAEGEGVSKIWPIFAYGSTDRLREKRTRGGRGSKIPKILRTYFMDAPLPEYMITQLCFLPPSGCLVPQFVNPQTTKESSSTHL